MYTRRFAGSGCHSASASIGRGIVYGYLPVELAVEGTPLEVEYLGDRLAATVGAETKPHATPAAGNAAPGDSPTT